MTNRSNSDLLKNIENSQILKRGDDVIITRSSEGTYRKGRYVESDEENQFCIKASIQPAKGDQILQVSENDRDKQILIVYSSFQMIKNDIMTRDEKEYEIQKVESWGSYTKSMAVLQDVSN